MIPGEFRPVFAFLQFGGVKESMGQGLPAVPVACRFGRSSQIIAGELCAEFGISGHFRTFPFVGGTIYR